MTALSDAITAATVAVGSGTHAGVVQLADYKDPDNARLSTIGQYLIILRDAGAAIKAAGGTHIQAGLKDTNGDPITTNNGWLGRKSSTHGAEGVEGVVIAGVDYPTWAMELRGRNF